MVKNNVFLVEGNDYVSRSNTIKNIIKDTNFNDIVINNYDVAETPLRQAIDDLNTYGLFSEKKIIIINNFDKLSIEENKKDIDDLIKYIDANIEDNLLIITGNKFDDRKKIIKELKQKTNFKTIDIDETTYIKEQLQGFKYDNRVITELERLCSHDITKLYNECQKLTNYKFNEKEITIDDVDKLVIQKIDNTNDLVFSLIRSIATKDTKNALKQYQELLNYNVEVLGILALLESQFRIIYQVKELANLKLTNDAIAEKLKEKPFRIKKTRELINYYTMDELYEIFNKLADIDLTLKTSDINGNFLLEQFIINL